jgi:hypothetical protein
LRTSGKAETLILEGMEPFRRKIIANIKAELKATGKTQEKLAY